MGDYWLQQRYDDAYYALHGHLPGQQPPRVIGTGSRAFTHAPTVEGALLEAVGDFGPALTVVHGHAKDGADALIDRIATRLGLAVERHPADWTGPCRATCRPGHRRVRRDGVTFCPAAGNYRSQEMVDLGAARGLAFLVERGVSPCTGTRDCARRAEAAGIPVRWFEQKEAAR